MKMKMVKIKRITPGEPTTRKPVRRKTANEAQHREAATARLPQGGIAERRYWRLIKQHYTEPPDAYMRTLLRSDEARLMARRVLRFPKRLEDDEIEFLTAIMEQRKLSDDEKKRIVFLHGLIDDDVEADWGQIASEVAALLHCRGWSSSDVPSREREWDFVYAMVDLTERGGLPSPRQADWLIALLKRCNRRGM